MKTFKEFLTEAVIKLRGFGDGSNHTERSERFVKDLHVTSKRHPLNNHARLVGNASVEVSGGYDGIHLHDIISHDPESGAGTKALKHLTKLADKHKVPIRGYAKAYSDREGHINKNKDLKGWYHKHGFEIGRGTDSSGYHIHYKPKE